MRRISIYGIILGVILIFGFSFNSAYSQTVTITFDELPDVYDYPLPFDQYNNLGVQFSSETGGPALLWTWGPTYPTVLQDPYGGVYSSPIAIKGSSYANVSVVATFVDPATGQPATTSFVEVVACSGPGGDPLSPNVALQAFNSSDELIDEDLADTTQQYDWLTVSAPGIAKVVMVAGGLLDIFDNFSFETVSPYPVDSDGDGVIDDDDNCIGTPNPDQADSDDDGVGDACDACPYDPANDADEDGVCGDVDNCLTVYNPEQIDSDDDGVGDACNDGEDEDGDEWNNELDNCGSVWNPDQADGDNDGLGDVCDACPYDPANDADGDGVCGDVDNCPATANSNQADNDLDGQGDACDTDDDNDGVLDVVDNCPLIANPNQTDSDEDGAGDACDNDNDNDGVLDVDDQCLFTPIGDIVDYSGCSIADLCPCDNQWKNHGAFVKCVAHTSEEFVSEGFITEIQKDLIVSNAAQSDCGHKK